MPQNYATNQSGAIYIPGYGWMSQTDYNALNIEPPALSQPAPGFEPPGGSWTSPPDPVNISPNEWAIPNYQGNYFSSPIPTNVAPPDTGGYPTGFPSNISPPDFGGYPTGFPSNIPPTEGGGYPFQLPGQYNPSPNEGMFPTPIPATQGAPGSITDIPGGNIPLLSVPSDQPGAAPQGGAFDPTVAGSGVQNPFATDPFPGIAPGGSPVGSFTPDAVASGIPLPGSFAGLGSFGPGSFNLPWQSFFGSRSAAYLAAMLARGIGRKQAIAMAGRGAPTEGNAPSQTGATQGAIHSGQHIGPV